MVHFFITMLLYCSEALLVLVGGVVADVALSFLANFILSTQN